MKNYSDREYLSATAMVRGFENHMVDRKGLQKMIDARSAEEAFKVVADTGMGTGFSYEEYEDCLSKALADTYRLVGEACKDPRVMELLRYKYDGHNLKTLLKARRTGTDPSAILSPLGNLEPKALQEELASGRYEKLNPRLAQAAEEGGELLAKVCDPQMVDILVDRAVLEASLETARQVGNRFLMEYCTAQTDIANIRSAVRLKRMGKDVFFLRRVLAPGGKVDEGKLCEAFPKGMEELLAVVSFSDYGRFLEPSFDSLRTGGTLTAFERLCDNYLVSLLAGTRMISFGLEPVVAYLLGRENEIKAVRIVMASKLAGVSPQQITERLRDSYA